MNIKLLKLAFSEVMSEIQLDFAITEATPYGATSAEVRTALAERYGKEAKGIWARRWAADPATADKAETVIYVMPYNLSRDLLKEVSSSFAALGYYVVPCTGNYNLNGFFSLEEIPAEKRRQKFFIETPMGVMKVSAKPGPTDYPGVYVDLISNGGDTASLACVEYDPTDLDIAVDVYPDGTRDNWADRTHIENLPGADFALAKKLISEFLADSANDETFANLEKVHLAWTSYEAFEALYIQSYADLVNPAIVTTISTMENGSDAVVVSRNEYRSLEELCNNELDILDFDCLLMVTDEEWKAFAASETGRQWLQEYFAVGTKVFTTAEVYDSEDECLEAYSCGVVQSITTEGLVQVKWKSGRVSAIRFGVDAFKAMKFREVPLWGDAK